MSAGSGTPSTRCVLSSPARSASSPGCRPAKAAPGSARPITARSIAPPLDPGQSPANIQVMTTATVFFERVLLPHRSLPPRGFHLLMLLLAAVSLAVGVGFV